MSANRIGVFDFDPAGCRALAEAVRNALAHVGITAEVVEFTAIPPITCAFRDEAYDMAFVVVEGMMAVEAARMVRESAADCPLFLVSGSGDYAMEGYRLHAADYLVKPVSPQRVVEALWRMEEIRSRNHGEGRGAH